MGRTKKVGQAGKFGVRYGKTIREKFIGGQKTRDGVCPSCLGNKVNRVSAGIWKCRKCGLKFAGKAYKPG
jgi:large subunit ribosomal protein L37Ae